MKTQNYRFLDILKERPVNSFEPLRMSFKQMPRIVKDLMREGHEIERKKEADTSTTYTLLALKPAPPQRRFEFVGNTAILIEE